MLNFTGLRLSPGSLIRMAADAVLLQAALLLALAVRFLFVVQWEGLGDVTVTELLGRYQTWYVRTALPLSALCLLVFFVTGFYTRARPTRVATRCWSLYRRCRSAFSSISVPYCFSTCTAGNLHSPKPRCYSLGVLASCCWLGRAFGIRFGVVRPSRMCAQGRSRTPATSDGFL